MTQSTIDIPGLPEGWKAVAFRVPNIDEFVLGDDGQVWLVQDEQECKQMIVKKIQPRRIVLEETEEERSVSYGDWYEDDLGRVNQWLNKGYGSSRCVKIWKEVKEK